VTPSPGEVYAYPDGSTTTVLDVEPNRVRVSVAYPGAAAPVIAWMAASWWRQRDGWTLGTAGSTAP
jgi:hypothetical protein